MNSLSAVRLFMEHHVVCVFDFMSLVKKLQHYALGSSLMWLPTLPPMVRRFLSEIYLDEDSDDLGALGVKSHFELYIEAMAEVGADTKGILDLVEGLKKGDPAKASVLKAPLPTLAQTFLLETLRVLNRDAAVVASVFYHSREAVIPDLFRPILDQLEAEGMACERLKLYLKRHIETDSEKHGPMGEQLLRYFEDQYPELIPIAQQESLRALKSRLGLWDGLYQSLQSRRMSESYDLPEATV